MEPYLLPPCGLGEVGGARADVIEALLGKVNRRAVVVLEPLPLELVSHHLRGGHKGVARDS